MEQIFKDCKLDHASNKILKFITPSHSGLLNGKTEDVKPTQIIRHDPQLIISYKKYT